MINLTEMGARARRWWRPSPAQLILLSGLATFLLVILFRTGIIADRPTPLEAMISANAPEESVYGIALGIGGTHYVATSVGLIAGNGSREWHRVEGVTAPVRAVVQGVGGELYLAGESMGVSRYGKGELVQLLGGNASALAIDPSDPSRLLAYISVSGLYESRDLGWSWEPLASVQGVEVLALAISPFDSSQVALGTLDGRLATSSDGGRTWHFPAGPRGTVTALVFDPHRPGHLWAAVNGRLYLSSDHGGTWKSVPHKAGDRVLVGLAPLQSEPGLGIVTVEGYLFRHTN